jgi:hypothetical protein
MESLGRVFNQDHAAPGVTIDFAWLLLLFPLVSVLLAGNLTTIELALATRHTFLGRMAT